MTMTCTQMGGCEELRAAKAGRDALREALENHPGNYKLTKSECAAMADVLATSTEPHAAPNGSGGWAQQAIEMEHQRDYYRQRAQTVCEHQKGEVWYWQGDGHDNLESLANSLPVVIRADQLREAIGTMEARKDAAYLERNQLVALLSKLFPAGKRKTAIEGWSEDWHGCVYIDLPTGQASWHYHDSQAHLFDHLPEYQGEYDGHTTEQKYQRIAGYEQTKAREPLPTHNGLPYVPDNEADERAWF